MTIRLPFGGTSSRNKADARQAASKVAKSGNPAAEVYVTQRPEWMASTTTIVVDGEWVEVPSDWDAAQISAEYGDSWD